MKSILPLFISFLLIAIFYSSCQFGHIKSVTGNYYLVAVDAGEDMCLTFKDEEEHSSFATIIPSTVFAVGFNAEYIIAKRHPRSLTDERYNDKTEYYILPIQKEIDYKQLDSLVRPMSKNEFHNSEENFIFQIL